MWLSKREINNQSDLHLKSNYGKYQYKIRVHRFFIDFKSAYYSIYREKLSGAIMESGIPTKLIRLVKTTMYNV